MDRIRGGDAIPTIHAEIIPPQPAAASMVHSSRTIDVYPEFTPPLQRPIRARSTRRWKGARILLGLAIALAALVIALLALRGPIANWLPGASEIYQAVGIPIAPAGPTLEDVRVIRIYSRDSVILNIEGIVANQTGRQIDIPPLSLVIEDANGAALQTIPITAAPSRLNPGGTNRFATEISDPPAAMAGIAIQIGDGRLQPIAIN